MCKSSKMRVSKRLIATSIIYGGAEARLRGVLEPPPVHATGGIAADLNTPSETEQDSPQQQDNHTDEDASADYEPQPDSSINMDFMVAIQKAAATFLIKVQESHGLPQSTIKNMIKEIQSLYEVCSYRFLYRAR